jgi:hypothetical protein
MDNYKQGDKVRRAASQMALDTEFAGTSRQHGKKIGTVSRVYEELGNAVCDVDYSDGTAETGVALDELEPAQTTLN